MTSWIFSLFGYGNFVPILVVETQGLEPYSFLLLGGEFFVALTGSKAFDEDFDLSEGDLDDYDEEVETSASTSDFDTKFESL